MNKKLYYALMLATLPLQAQESNQESEPVALDEITVTSDLREDTTVNEVSSSITVMTQETIQRTAEQHFGEVLDRVPNLNWSSATNRPRYLHIRGIGERSQYEGAPNPSVGFLVDDIDFSGIGGVATLFDVDRIEVLRGPQGTRYGANALAGMVYVRTAEPQLASQSRIQTIVGDDNTYGVGFSSTGAISDEGNAAYRFALHQYQSDGFRRNDFFNSDDTNERDEFTARVKFAWTAGTDWDFKLTGLWVDLDNGFDTFSPENDFLMHTDDPGRDAQESLGLSLRSTYNGWGGAELLSITTFADSDITYSFDGDWGNPIYWGEFSPYDFTSETLRERQNFTQELRWISTADSMLFNGTTDWLAGIYFSDLSEDNQFEDFFNDEIFRFLTSDYDAQNIAAFGQLDFNLSEQTVLTTGLRIEQRDADYADLNGLDLSPSDTMVGGQIALNHTLDSGNTIYTSLSRGYKAGGFNLGLSIPENRRQFDPEYLWNIEAGIKGSTAGGRAVGSMAIFYSERDDMQVGTSFQLDPTDPLTFIFFTDNAASGTNYGVEAEGQIFLTEGWSLDGSVSLLETEFDDFVTAERSLNGREQAHAPGYQFAIGTEYRHPSGWFGRVDVTGRDDFYFSDSHDQQSESYELVNVKLGYEAANWSVHAWARNVTDEFYATRGFFFGLEPPEFATTEYVQPGDPRHVGITARFHF